jgi:hypothetical protein
MITFPIMETMADPKRRRSRRVGLLAAAAAAFTIVGRRLGYGFGINTIVRCRSGHLFTTVWLPGVNLTALDLVVARVQYCPVGRHWSLVTPVRAADLSARRRRQARARRDIPLP